jgi:hypothetical protein
MKTLAIVAMCVCAAVVFGIVHDQITARICVEYFTIGHPPVFHTNSPTLLGLGWGVIATWWVGLMLGVPLAMVARLGTRPKLDPASLARPLALLPLIMACCSFLSGMTGYLLARNGSVFLVQPMATAVPVEKHVRFLADLWAHSASYLVGFVGGVVLIAMTWRKRSKLSFAAGG